MTVSPDGTISVNGAVAGKIKLVEFPPGTDWKVSAKLITVPRRRAAPPAKQSTIAQGSLESSNVNPVAGAVELVAVQRYAEMMQRALSMFHTEFNRIATEELPQGQPVKEFMFRALYTAASGMNAQQLNLDNVANNLANTSTAGFRRRRVQFTDLLVSEHDHAGFGVHAADHQRRRSAGWFGHQAGRF